MAAHENSLSSGKGLLNTRDRALRVLLVKKHQERRWGVSCQGAGRPSEEKVTAGIFFA